MPYGEDKGKHFFSFGALSAGKYLVNLRFIAIFVSSIRKL